VAKDSSSLVAVGEVLLIRLVAKTVVLFAVLLRPRMNLPTK
jgi:hypothetical protein